MKYFLTTVFITLIAFAGLAANEPIQHNPFTTNLPNATIDASGGHFKVATNDPGSGHAFTWDDSTNNFLTASNFLAAPAGRTNDGSGLTNLNVSTNVTAGSGIAVTSSGNNVTIRTNGTPLAGDVTGPTGTTVVAAVGGQTAANVAAGSALATAATNAAIASTLVRRDSSGAFSTIGLTLGDAVVTSPSAFNITLNSGANVVMGGDDGVFLNNFSTNILNSGASYFITLMVLSNGVMVVKDPSAASFALVPANRLEAVNNGNALLVFNNDVTSLKGLYIASPGIGFDGGNYSTFATTFTGTKLTGVPFWQPGVYQADGVSYTFHVSGVTVIPIGPALYTNSAGGLFLVGMNTVSGGSGTVNMSARGVSPSASGTLGKVPGSGTGDNTLTYSSFDTVNWVWAWNVNPSTGLMTANKSAVVNGTLGVNGTQWNATSALTNLLNGGVIDPNSTGVTVSNLIVGRPNYGGSGAVAVDVSGGGGTGVANAGNGLALVQGTTTIVTINNNGSSVGTPQIRLEGSSANSEINPNSDGVWNLGDPSKRFGAIFAKTNIATGLSSYRAGFQAIGNLATSQAVTFATPLASAVGTNYSVTINSDSTLASAVGFSAGSKTTNGFTINLSAGIAGGIGVDYTAVPYQ